MTAQIVEQNLFGKDKMVEIVKSIGEAQKIQAQSGSSDLGKIISDVKNIIDGIKDLRGLQSPKTENPVNNSQYKQMTFNDEEQKKLPFGVIKFNDDAINNLIDNDLTIFINNLDDNLTLKDLKQKFPLFKELIKGEVKNYVNKIAKGEIEYR